MSDDDVLAPVRAILEGADRRDWPAVRAAFAPEVMLDYGTPERLAPDAIVDRWRGVLGALERTEHRLLDPVVRRDGELAKVESRFVAHHDLEGRRWTLEGRYQLELTRTEAGPRVRAMRMIPERSTGDTELLARALERARRADVARAKNRAIIEASLDRLEALDIDGFVALFAPDAVQRMPYSPPGFPAVLEGRDAIRAQYAGIATAFRSMRFVERELVATLDPERFVARFRGEIELRDGGRYDNAYVSFYRLRDGRITEVMEHFDPLVLQRAFGGDAASAAHR